MSTFEQNDKFGADSAKPKIRRASAKSGDVVQRRNKIRADYDVNQVDFLKPLEERPMIGSDVEQWRSALGLDRNQAMYVLGLNSLLAYTRTIQGGVLPITTEILLRLYYMSPTAAGWKRYTFRDVFNQLYLNKFLAYKEACPEYATGAAIDFAERFCMLFDRSKTRAYDWFGESYSEEESMTNSVADLQAILTKLPYIENGAKVFEEVSIHCWKLRGVDFNKEFPLPAIGSAPRRLKNRSNTSSSVGKQPLWQLLLPQTGSETTFQAPIISSGTPAGIELAMASRSTVR